MAAKNGRRRFGNVRKLPSGRWQARYPGPDGQLRPAPETFARKTDADRYLTLVEAAMDRGDWIDPARSRVKLGDYASRWISQRPNLRPRTVELYTWLLRQHIDPYLGGVPLANLNTSLIREWRAELLKAGVSLSATAKAYRLLRAVLMTAVNEDGILPRNPCRIPGAGEEKAPERPTLTVQQVFALAEAMPPRLRAMVLLATFASLRYGEVSALQRRDIDLERGIVRVRQAFVELDRGGLTLGPPKSRAGLRTVAVPDVIMPDIRKHLATYADSAADAWVFTGPRGGPIKRSNFNPLSRWREAVTKIGMPELHFHDLRHTGNTLAARAGASTRELMARMGHDSMAAAIIYQHVTSAADRAIADAVDAQLRAELDEDDDEDGPTGTLMARSPN